MSYRLLKIQLGIEETTPVSLSDSTDSYEILMLESNQLVQEQFMLENSVDYKLSLIHISEPTRPY